MTSHGRPAVASRAVPVRRRELLSLCLGLLGAAVPTRGGGGRSPTLLVHDPLFHEHRMEGHPERPERLLAIMRALEPVPGLERVAPRPATLAELGLVHTPGHIERVRALAAAGGGWIDADTYVTPRTFDAATLAVGALLTAVDRIAAGQARNAFCAVRPPGHHASAARAMGFCLFNQVAVAARYIQRATAWTRVLIVDFDVHHGNGTQEIVAGDRSLFYLSVHRSPFYPGTGAVPEHDPESVLNLPFRPGSLREEILSAFATSLRGVATRFRPDFVLVSAGFDAYKADPIGGLGYEIDDYRRLMDVVVEVAPAGRIVSSLEGGYDLAALGACARAHLEPMLR